MSCSTQEQNADKTSSKCGQKNNSNPQQVNISRRAAGSNWQNALPMQEKSESLSKSTQSLPSDKIDSTDNGTQVPKKKTKSRPRKRSKKFVAMDCEMVGTGPSGIDDMLARVSIVNRNGEILLDKYVKPRETVTDYRTKVSGIRPEDIENGEDFEKIQDEVVAILQDKILVGHAIKHDLRVLYIKHPQFLIRDTSNYRPLAKLVSNGHTPSLKRVAKIVLGIDIQKGEHSSVEDARAAMQIYNRLHVDWEKYIQKKGQHHEMSIK